MPLRAFGGGLGDGANVAPAPGTYVAAGPGATEAFGIGLAGVPIGGGVGGGVAARAGSRASRLPAKVRVPAASAAAAKNENGFTQLALGATAAAPPQIERAQTRQTCTP